MGGQKYKKLDIIVWGGDIVEEDLSAKYAAAIQYGLRNSVESVKPATGSKPWNIRKK